MKRIILLLLLTLALAPAVQAAQGDVPVQSVIKWVLPTKATDGTALTGAQALTKLQVFFGQAPIGDNTTDAPVAELAPTATTYTHTTAAPPGSTLYYRLKACNVGGCSPLSAEASKPVTVSVPAAPSSVSITVAVIVAVQP